MAFSKGLFIFLAFMGLIISVAVYVSKQPGGYITTQGGSVCSWRTDGDPSTERGFILDCSCPNGVEYKCRYQARPDEDCPKFWKNLLPYFTNLTASVSSDGHGCDSEFHKISFCPEDFKVRRIGGLTPHNCD